MGGRGREGDGLRRHQGRPGLVVVEPGGGRRGDEGEAEGDRGHLQPDRPEVLPGRRRRLAMTTTMTMTTRLTTSCERGVILVSFQVHSRHGSYRARCITTTPACRAGGRASATDQAGSVRAALSPGSKRLARDRARF